MRRGVLGAALLAAIVAGPVGLPMVAAASSGLSLPSVDVGSALLALGAVLVGAWMLSILAWMMRVAPYVGRARALQRIGVRVGFAKRFRLWRHKAGIIRAVYTASVYLPMAALGMPVPLVALLTGSPAKGNHVHAGGVPYSWSVATFKVKTVTSLRSGVAVIMDTTDSEIKVAGATALNVLGFLTENNISDPDWVQSTAPVAADEIDVVLCGSGAWAWVRNGANLLAGAKAVTSAAGVLAAFPSTPAAGDTRAVVGHLLDSSDGSGTETDAIIILGGP